MRKWHRWLSVTFGVVLLWIAVTGMLSQVVPLVIEAGQSSAPAAAAPAKPAFICPPDYTCRPKPQPGDPRALIGLLHHLHSGESFGPVGVALFTLAGFAMVFFAFSGMWLYVQMWQNRKERSLKPGWFWK
ncbi:PepSY domain-containing protein [Novosphingobium sp. NPDC080210]|uniref:PepSY domain-containing protein n=1 Tax=Novosphingobium sp. NPDC080210 TaxID=3390596 RepID=UPI003D036CF7